MMALRLSHELETTDEAILGEYGLDRRELSEIAQRYRRFGIWKGNAVKLWCDDWQLEAYADVGRGLIRPSWCRELDIFAYRFTSMTAGNKYYERFDLSLHFHLQQVSKSKHT